MAGTPTYNVRRNMIQRCTNPNYHRYADHGGRGISICDRWLASFDNFLADMGEAPPGLSIERIDNDGNYEPGNCRWATPIEQASNKRNNKFVARDGVAKTVAAWCQTLGIPHSVVLKREMRGWPEDQWFIPPRSQPRSDKGATRTAEVKARLSESAKKRSAMVSAQHKGKKRSPDTCAKITAGKLAGAALRRATIGYAYAKKS